MGVTDITKLDDMQLSVLTEIGNIGCGIAGTNVSDRKSTRLNSSHWS